MRSIYLKDICGEAQVEQQWKNYQPLKKRINLPGSQQELSCKQTICSLGV